VKVGQESNGLNGFPQAHLVRQDTVPLFLVIVEKPVQARNLVGMEVSRSNKVWLSGKRFEDVLLLFLLTLIKPAIPRGNFNSWEGKKRPQVGHSPLMNLLHPQGINVTRRGLIKQLLFLPCCQIVIQAL